jgi:hypothetical protein
LIAEEKTEPFCSRLSRLAVAVDELKNASQFVVIWAAAPELVPAPETVAEGLAEELAVAVADAAADDVAVGGVVDEVLELLEQAVAVSATTMAPAIARPVAGWNLIASLRELRPDKPVAAGLLVFIVCPQGVALLRAMGRLPTRASGAVHPPGNHLK